MTLLFLKLWINFCHNGLRQIFAKWFNDGTTPNVAGFRDRQTITLGTLRLGHSSFKAENNCVRLGGAGRSLED